MTFVYITSVSLHFLSTELMTGPEVIQHLPCEHLPAAGSSKEHVKTVWLKPRRKIPDEQVFWNRMSRNPRQRSGPCSSHWTSRASKHMSISGIWGFSFHRVLWREARGNTKNCQTSQEDISSFTDAIVIIQCTSSPLTCRLLMWST